MQSFLDVSRLGLRALSARAHDHRRRSRGTPSPQGALLGIVFGLALTYGGRLVSVPFRVVVDVVRGTPVLVLILASFYMPSGLGLSPGPITAGIVALAVFCAAHVGETLRGALLAIPPAQTDAATRDRPDLRPDPRLCACAAGDAPDRAELRQHRGRDRQGVVAALGDRRRRAPPHHPGDHRPHLQDDGVLCACGGLYLVINLVIGTGGSWLERRFRLR